MPTFLRSASSMAGSIISMSWQRLCFPAAMAARSTSRSIFRIVGGSWSWMGTSFRKSTYRSRSEFPPVLSKLSYESSDSSPVNYMFAHHYTFNIIAITSSCQIKFKTRAARDANKHFPTQVNMYFLTMCRCCCTCKRNIEGSKFLRQRNSGRTTRSTMLQNWCDFLLTHLF